MKRQDAADARNARLPEPDEGLDRLASETLGACVEVHRELGPGFLESTYEAALCVELERRGIRFERQVPIRLVYKEQVIGRHQIDLIVADRLVVELKAIEALAPIHAAQVRSYLKATRLTLGLLVNFNSALLLRGVRRIILSV